MCPVDYWGVMVGLGLLAASFGVIAFVRYREREASTLQRQTVLARELRDLAGDDEVRLAAVDEFSLAIYQRLFYASVVAPWIRSAAWALLGTVLAGAGALAVEPLDGVFATIAYICAIGVAAIFAVATLVCAGTALYHSATTPRVSFSDSYAAQEPGDIVPAEARGDTPAADTPAPATPTADTDTPEVSAPKVGTSKD
ncbi:hypothetical protein [Gordonia jinghuaiqii]|uniref:hypothetical protein n=1 Tax=Gordonia jinghuaiqii TaxID=2758710 RepID=UPI001FD549E5|nr:hypothetical protein [Gordonia jinghuaiqii]